MSYDVQKVTYQEVTIFDRPALFTECRIDRATVPEGVYRYELRHGDADWGEPIELSRSLMLCRNFGVETPQPDVSRVGQVFDGMEVQDRRGVVDSLQKYFRKLQNDIQREISPQERKQPEQNRPVR